MSKTIHGKIRGKTIEIDEELGLAEGQEVEVQVTVIQLAREWGEGNRRSAGGWVDHPEMCAVLEKIYQERKLERRN